mmetsp:Transcript_25719/g.28859  ORF Transcript_25719/g.28859 Transcript_25719/m.28859 type:complete len:153 (+) Transcript_25719:95-553(+)
MSLSIQRLLQAQVKRQRRNPFAVASRSVSTISDNRSFHNRSFSTTGVVVDATDTNKSTKPKSNILNKKYVVDHIASTHDISSKKSQQIVETFLDTIIEAVVNGKIVRLTGFGAFDSYMSKPRNGVNPRTAEKVEIPSKQRFRFKAYGSFKKS